jgi:chromosomal replication initiation ATPase DnaA
MNILNKKSDHWIDTVWWRTCERLRAEMDPRRYAFWIGPLRILTADEQRVVIACSSPHFREQTVVKFGAKITDLIAEYAPNLCAVDFVVDPEKEPAIRPVEPRAVPSVVSQRRMPAIQARSKPAAKAGDAASGERRILVEHIKRMVAEHLKVTIHDLESSSRKRAHVRPRQIAIYFARELSGRSFPEIARRFGGRDHTTAIHSCNKVRCERESNPVFAAELEAIRRLVMHSENCEHKALQNAASERQDAT